MSLIAQSYKTSRWNDFWWGINLRTSSDAIDDKQWTVGNNMSSEWNKLVTIPWYVEYYTPSSWVTKSQWIALYSWKILTLHNRNLYLYDTATWSLYTKANAVWNNSDTYSILTTKSFSSGNISIVIININVATTEDIVAYEFDGSTFITKTFTSLTDKNFKCWAFYEWKLWLGWNPKFPSSLYTSRTWSVLNSWYIYDFSAYDSSSQNIWDGEPIVSVVTNHNELFVFKTNSIWRLNSTKDTWSIMAYIFKQETATWALNSRCVVPVEQDIIYFDWINIRRLSYEVNINSLNDDSISKEINPIIESLPSSQASNATMYFVYPFVKLFLRDKFSINNSVAIVYNIVDKSFSTQSWLEVIQWVWGFVNNKRTAYFITSQTSTIYQDNVWYTYNWGNIQFNHKSKRYVLWDWVDYKRISQVELYGSITPWLIVNIDIMVNGSLVDTRQISFNEYILPTTWSSQFGDTLLWGNNEEDVPRTRDFVVRYEYFNDWRDFQFSVRWNWQWRFELHWLNLMYKSIKAYDIHN